MGSGIPVWKFLINCPLTMEDRLSLITAIFSRCKEIEIITGLSGDDAQSFVDVIDEVLPHSSISKRRCTDFNSNFLVT